MSNITTRHCNFTKRMEGLKKSTKFKINDGNNLSLRQGFLWLNPTFEKDLNNFQTIIERC